MVKGERGSDVRELKAASGSLTEDRCLRGWGLYQMAGCGGTISYLLKDVDESPKYERYYSFSHIVIWFFFTTETLVLTTACI